MKPQRPSAFADAVPVQRHPRHARSGSHALDGERRQAMLSEYGPGGRDQAFVDHEDT